MLEKKYLGWITILGIVGWASFASAQTANDRLVGKWRATIEIDEEKFREGLSSQGYATELIDQILPQVIERCKDATVTIEFRDDQTMTLSPRGLPGDKTDEQLEEQASWRVTKEEDEVITMEWIREGETEGKETELTFDGDSFQMSDQLLDNAPIKTPKFQRVEEED